LRTEIKTELLFNFQLLQAPTFPVYKHISKLFRRVRVAPGEKREGYQHHGERRTTLLDRAAAPMQHPLLLLLCAPI
jgi:hypothetical protein